jgi:hypothetical protein
LEGGSWTLFFAAGIDDKRRLLNVAADNCPLREEWERKSFPSSWTPLLLWVHLFLKSDRSLNLNKGRGAFQVCIVSK